MAAIERIEQRQIDAHFLRRPPPRVDIEQRIPARHPLRLIRGIVEGLGREVASPAEVRAMLGLKGR